MKKKIVGILIMALLIATATLQVSGNIKKTNKINEMNTFTNSNPEIWYMFHRDQYNTGHTHEVGGIQHYSERWNYSTNDEIRSSPAIGDVDKDGKLEIIFGSLDKKIYCIDGWKVLRWSYSTADYVASSPAIMYNNVYIGTGDGRILCLAGTTSTPPVGELVWAYPPVGNIGPVYSSPTLGDLDGDGGNEVVVGSEDNNVYCLRGDGLLKWIFPTDDHVYSTPAIGDVDGDGENEVLVSSWDKKLYCIDGNSGVEEWSFQTSDIFDSSPVIGDVDGGGDIEVIICGHDDIVWCINGSTADAKWFTDVESYIAMSTPAIGDIDDDGIMEVVGLNMGAKVFALNGTNGEEKWSYLIADPGGGLDYSSPVLADIDGDTEIEVIVGSVDNNIYCLDGSPPNPPTGFVEWTHPTNGWVKSSPALADIDGDGEIEIAVGSDDGNLYVLDGHSYYPTPERPVINGPNEGVVGVPYTFEFSPRNPCDYAVSYYIQWESGDITDWTPFQNPDEPYIEEHTWDTVGLHTIMAKIRNVNAESGTAFWYIQVPRNRDRVININPIIFNLFEQFPKIFPILGRLLQRLI